MRRVVVPLGRLNGALLAGCALLSLAQLAVASSTRQMGSAIEVSLVLGAVSVIWLSARLWLPAVLAPLLGGLTLMLKPAIAPLSSTYGEYSYTAETHLYLVVPGVLLIAAATTIGAARAIPPSVVGLDGPSRGKDLLSAVGIGLGSIGAGAVLLLWFFVDRASLWGVVTQLLPGLLSGAAGVVALVAGVPSALDEGSAEPLRTSLAGELTGDESLIRELARAPAVSVSPWLDTAAAPDAPLPAPIDAARLGRFEILGEVGAGGMGRVVRARDPKLLRDVALKLLPPGLAKDSSRRERLLREARAAARIAHPNVLSIFEIEEAADAPYIVMELVDGMTLRSLLQRGPPPLDLVWRIAEQIASGLGAAHRQGVVHRDLKPENVAVSADGHVKILDFGIARIDAQSDLAAVDELGGGALVTREGQLLGTPAYMSPEQARAERVDARTDVFAFGALLFELATGEPAFLRQSLLETRAAVLAAQLPDAAARRLPPPLLTVIRTALQLDLTRRPTNGDALLGLLTHARAECEAQSARAI